MSSSLLVDNKGKDILVLGERPTKGLDDNILLILLIQEEDLY